MSLKYKSTATTADCVKFLNETVYKSTWKRVEKLCSDTSCVRTFRDAEGNQVAVVETANEFTAVRERPGVIPAHVLDDDMKIANGYYFCVDSENSDEYPMFCIVKKSFYDKHQHLDDRERGQWLNKYGFCDAMEAIMEFNGTLEDGRKKLIELGMTEKKLFNWDGELQQ